MIGNELFFSLLMIGQIPIPKSSIVLQKTKLGWIVAGKYSSETPQNPLNCNISIQLPDFDLRKFWEIEAGPHEQFLSEEEQMAQEHFLKTMSRDPINGKFTVWLLFNNNKSELGESYSMALNRYLRLERSLTNRPDFWNEYVKFITKYIELGHMSLSRSKKQEGYYLSHHAVIKESSLTTKLRIVFDASAKTSSGISLNDTHMNGPILHEELLAIFIRFRMHPIVLTADIA